MAARRVSGFASGRGHPGERFGGTRSGWGGKTVSRAAEYAYSEDRANVASWHFNGLGGRVALRLSSSHDAVPLVNGGSGRKS